MRRLMPIRTPAPDRYPAGLTREIPIALFVAQHRHSPDQCPASPGSGPLLLHRVSAATAARYGVTIEAEALIDGEHLLLLVVQAASQQAVEGFLEFLPGPGCLRVLPACSAEEAVQRGGCGPVFPQVPGGDLVTGATGGPELRCGPCRWPRSAAPQSPADAPPPSVRAHSTTSSKPVRRRRAR
jgi:hypothetical protein